MVRKFRALAIAASCAAAIALSAPAQAQAVHVGNFNNGPGGNACPASQGSSFSDCYATQAGTQSGAPTDPLLLGSPAVYKLGDDGGEDFSTLFTSIDGDEFNVWLTGSILNFTYTPGADDPFLHYFAVKQAGPNTGYALFYDDDPIFAGSIDLATYFPNNVGWSSITFFDSNTPPVPEPGTWAMMLIGFGGIGYAMRRRRKASGGLLQIA